MKNNVQEFTLAEAIARLRALPETASVHVANLIPTDSGGVCITVEVHSPEFSGTVVFPPMELPDAIGMAIRMEDCFMGAHNKPAAENDASAYPFFDSFPSVAGKSNGPRCGCIGFRCTCRTAH